MARHHAQLGYRAAEDLAGPPKGIIVAMHPFKGPAARALKRMLRYPRELRAKARDRAALARPLPYYLAACAIFRNEAPYLEEWLVFHLGVGVEHFYLYENRSIDDFRTVLAPFVDRGQVTLVGWPKPHGQKAAYLHCLRSAVTQTRWITFLDLDEFLFSPRQRDIRPILENYRELPSLQVRRATFGSSGHKSKPAGGILESYTRRAAELRGPKSIANPRLIRAIHNPHQFSMWGDDETHFCDELRINHYWSRSMEELLQKLQRGDAWFKRERLIDWHMSEEARLNDVEDRCIQPIAREIREAFSRARSGDGACAGVSAASTTYRDRAFG
jgi:hypothetical protein